jgi:hypothetical protein
MIMLMVCFLYGPAQFDLDDHHLRRKLYFLNKRKRNSASIGSLFSAVSSLFTVQDNTEKKFEGLADLKEIAFDFLQTLDPLGFLYESSKLSLEMYDLLMAVILEETRASSDALLPHPQSEPHEKTAELEEESYMEISLLNADSEFHSKRILFLIQTAIDLISANLQRSNRFISQLADLFLFILDRHWKTRPVELVFDGFSEGLLPSEDHFSALVVESSIVSFLQVSIHCYDLESSRLVMEEKIEQLLTARILLECPVKTGMQLMKGLSKALSLYLPSLRRYSLIPALFSFLSEQSQKSFAREDALDIVSILFRSLTTELSQNWNPLDVAEFLLTVRIPDALSLYQKFFDLRFGTIDVVDESMQVYLYRFFDGLRKFCLQDDLIPKEAVFSYLLVVSIGKQVKNLSPSSIFTLFSDVWLVFPLSLSIPACPSDYGRPC